MVFQVIFGKLFFTNKKIDFFYGLDYLDMEDYLLRKLEIGNKIREIFLDFLWEKISGNWREKEGMIGCVGVLWWSFDEDFLGNIFSDFIDRIKEG